MSDNLKKETLVALFWSFSERFGTQLIQFGISVTLARILLPEHFGLIAMLSIFIALSNTLINSGFGQALIQKQNIQHVDECSIFYFNFLVALFTTIILFFSAPLIADFFEQPELKQITRVLSLTLLFNSLGLVQRTLLAKNLDFKTQLKVSLLSIIISASLSIYLGLNGFGVWSLVALHLSKDFFNTIFLWFFSSWRPSLIFSFVSLKSMFSFGSRLFLVSLSNSVFVNIYQIIIGKFFSPNTLGFYSRADSLYKYPITLLSGVVSQVTFPVFSKIQNDKRRLKSAVKKSLRTITFITFPLMVGLILVASPLVEVLLTDKWLPSVPYLQLLCIIGLIYPISVINLNALNAQGRSDLFLKIDIINKILILVVVLITYRFSITAMILGQILNSFFSYYLYTYHTGKLLNYSFIDQIKDTAPNLFISIIMGFFIYIIRYLNIDNQLFFLLFQIFIGMFTYIVFCYVFKIKVFQQTIIQIKNLVKIKK